jgi:DNA (cytosine-5)-methyltransferase 1
VDFSLKHLALFNGIGGFQLAASWMGWENVAHVEINDWCNKVVKQHFPNSKCYTDIKNFDGKQYANTIDIISGGFPCQPFSIAGKRKGTEDERYLWPEMLRIIREVKPTFIVGENVSGIWPMVDQICSEVENEGYEIEPIDITACAVGAGHIRERYWFLAYSKRFAQSFGIFDRNGNKTEGWNKGTQIGCENRQLFEMASNANKRVPGWEWEFSEPKLVRIPHGVSDELDRIKALGNAIVPQVAYEIFEVIQMAAIADKERGQKVLI